VDLGDDDHGDYDVELSPAPIDPRARDEHSVLEKEENSFVILYSQFSGNGQSSFMSHIAVDLWGRLNPVSVLSIAKVAHANNPSEKRILESPTLILACAIGALVTGALARTAGRWGQGEP
jgi:hypothetical protein